MDDVVLSLVPRILAQYFEADPRPLNEPRAVRLRAAAIFADISGFTSLTETLARRGAPGIEELTSTLNRHFGALIDTIDAHGGDIFKFAGDALLALWPAADEDTGDDLGADLRTTFAGEAALMRSGRAAGLWKSRS